jgi:flagellum-specific peptidoglycan hydrolase FlgJ
MAGKRFQYTGAQNPGNVAPKEFISKISSMAINACFNTGILPSVVIGIALQESYHGNDYKSFIFNNPFGHKAFASWEGDGVRKGTGKAPYWRVYPTLKDSFKATVGILQQGKFKIQGVALKKTPLAQLNSLQKGGYNVGPDKSEYAGIINKSITQYNLQGYDKQMQAMERSANDNNLAFHEQDYLTQGLHSIFA